MIVSFFATGQSNGEAPVNYLMSQKDHTGKLRSVSPEVIDGDPRSTIQIINGINREYKYTSGAIAFRNEEKPSPTEINRIINKFRQVMLPGLTTDNFNDLWVLHQDKGNYELHFVIPMIELTSGKQLNIMPPGKKSQDHVNNFVKIINHSFGWKQVVADPLKVALSDFKADGSSHGVKSHNSKKPLPDRLRQMIMNGDIKSRSQLIDTLQSCSVEITREGNDYISIKLPGQIKARKLKGELFKAEANYPELVKQYQTIRAKENLSVDEHKAAENGLREGMGIRKAFNIKTYLTTKADFTRKPKINKNNNKKDLSMTTPPNDKNLDKPKNEIDNSSIKTPEISAVRRNIKFIRMVSSGDDPSLPSINAGGSTLSINIQIGRIEAMIEDINSKIGKETNPQKKEKLYSKLNSLKQTMAGLLAQLASLRSKAAKKSKPT